MNKKIKEKLSEVRQLKKKLDVSGFAIGWQGPYAPKTVRDWFFSIPGWLLTALAESLGAPFWFDLLGKFLNIRGAGTRPEKSKST